MRTKIHIAIAILLGICVSTQAQSPHPARQLVLVPETMLWSFPQNTLLVMPGLFESAQNPPNHYQLTSYLTTMPHVESNFVDRFSVEVHTPFLTELSIPVVDLWKGHLEIDGFNSTQYNVQFGPTGIGQPMRSPSHDQLGVNRADDLSGIRLRLNFQKGAHRRKFGAV